MEQENLEDQEYILIGKLFLYEIKINGLPIKADGLAKEKGNIAKAIGATEDKIIEIAHLAIKHSLELTSDTEISNENYILLGKLYIDVCKNIGMPKPEKFLKQVNTISEKVGVEKKLLQEIYFLVFKLTVDYAIKERDTKKIVVVGGFAQYFLNNKT
jgi:hypothetical protein